MRKYSLEKIQKSALKPWSPVNLVEFNNQALRVAIFEGEYPWHTHINEDECFLVWSGQIEVQTKNDKIVLNPGDITTVPKGIKHRPVAKLRSLVVMIEPKQLNSKGDTP